MSLWESRELIVQGAAGAIEAVVELPINQPLFGLALIAHPHPLFGGTMDNKVVQSMARAYLAQGVLACRFNFRGVGRSNGQYDDGVGEQDDFLAMLQAVRELEEVKQQVQSQSLPWFWAGFSFGAMVVCRVWQQCQLRSHDCMPVHTVLVGIPVGRWDIPPPPKEALLIHGQCDQTVPLSDLYPWLAVHDQPVTVVAGADHFFHKKLHVIKQIIQTHLKAYL